MTIELKTVGWLGCGRMGTAAAIRLINAGHPVTVWNRTKSKTAPLTDAGAGVVDTIPELADNDIVFVCVSTSSDLEEVVIGPNGLLSRDRKPKIVVDCSTVSAESSALVRQRASEAGVAFIASPVSGNAHVVAEGGACLIASGPREIYDVVEPYLKTLGKVAVWAGEQEQSRLVKLAHNLYLGMMVQALAEVTSLAEKAGVPRANFLEFLNGTVLGSDWVRKRTPDLVAFDLTPTFTMTLLRKDFDLGLAAARAEEVPMPVAATVHQNIQAAIGLGHADNDLLSLFAAQATLANLDVEKN
ncbi:3-hydroxyisobutyrate dehydrogenase [Sinosporangium album]|uniref:3-hydroxyisobutyrate dehydrogenase n=1 Tax=Sinosporangium album TaxID=504805 RepID=A0A1G8CA03_9ACTN|nr:NAD(P)-dependent oxidoreductase [Sinosporangium album]SDH42103.1 3-hydroxyisobutyrate dehydrogenase [Sinosporangium album]